MKVKASALLSILLGFSLQSLPSTHTIVNALSTQSAVFTQSRQSIIQVHSPPNLENNSLKNQSININGKTPTAIHLPYSSAIEALKTYKTLHGNLVIPRRYIIPPDHHPYYPSEWHTIDLSSTVYNMKWWQRHIRHHPTRVEELNHLGFIWERLQPEWNLVLEALIIYSSLHNHLLVPTSFVVPHHNDSIYPRATWGIQLGKCVHRIRSRQDFIRGRPDRVAQLNGLNFIWDLSDFQFQKFANALHHFKTLEKQQSTSPQTKKALRIPNQYVIPHHDPDWPSELWGYPLGEKCHAVRQKQIYVKNHPERKELLERLGFVFGGNSILGWLEVVHAAAIYSRMHGRNLAVPTNFVIPAPPRNTEEEWPWPEQLWGLPLGQRLRDVRVKGRYLTGSNASSRRAQLNALGFDWSPKRGRRKRSLGA